MTNRYSNELEEVSIFGNDFVYPKIIGFFEKDVITPLKSLDFFWNSLEDDEKKSFNSFVFSLDSDNIKMAFSMAGVDLDNLKVYRMKWMYAFTKNYRFILKYCDFLELTDFKVHIINITGIYFFRVFSLEGIFDLYTEWKDKKSQILPESVILSSKNEKIKIFTNVDTIDCYEIERIKTKARIITKVGTLVVESTGNEKMKKYVEMILNI